MIPIIAAAGIDDIALFVAISLVVASASLVLSELLRPKPKVENARAASLSDFNFPTAEEGRVIPLIWGTVRIDGPNVVWYGDFRQEPITQTIKTGLWSSKKVTKGFRYYIGMQMALCKGRIDSLLGVWVGDEKVWTGSVQDGNISVDRGDLFGGVDFGYGGVVGEGQIFSGRSDEPAPAPGDYLHAFQDPHIAYRGTCYFLWKGGYIGNSTSLSPFKFELRRCPNGLGVAGGKHVISTNEANPACVLYEILTDTDWGFGFSSSVVDLVNFRTAAETLHTEGNGLSMIVDTAREAADVMSEIERQMDGVVYLDPLDGKFKITLARGGYDINAVPQLTSANVMEIAEFTRGTWDETSNQVRISFCDRGKEYKDSYAVASDLANQRIQQGAVVPATVSYPGVKSRTLAQNIASRELKYRSTPLAKATLVVDRSLWRLKPGDVVAWTDAGLGFTKLPARISRVDLGNLKEGRVELALAQDIFQYAPSVDGVSDDTLWTSPDQGVVPFPADEQLALEAPYAIARRDPERPGILDRLWVAGRSQQAGGSFRIYERNAGGVPAGAYSLDGEVFGFMRIGQLKTAITSGTTVTIDLDPGPDSVGDLLASFTTATGADIGQNLTNLMLVGDEFFAVRSATDQTTFVRLNNAYRGLLDTIPQPHSMGDPVYLLCTGAGLSEVALPPTYNVDVQLRPRSRDDEVTEIEATTIALTFANRARRPYPAALPVINAAQWPSSSSIDVMKGGGTTDDDKGLTLTFFRRDFRNYDEVQSIQGDAAGFVSDFPAANTTQENCDLIQDPDGVPSVVETKAWAQVTTFFFSRTKILRANAAARPARLRVEVGTRHTYAGTVYENREDLGHSFDTAASEIDGWTNMGVLAQNVVGAAYTAPTTGVYAFSVGPLMTGGDVQARINGGGWSTIIGVGSRTGSLAGVTAGDTIEVRQTQAGTGETFLHVDAPGSAADAYAILVL